MIFDPTTSHHLEIGDLLVDFLVVGPFMENAYVVRRRESDEAVLIDPGADPERLIALLSQLDLQPVAVLNTHAHLDHFGAVKPLQERYGVPFYLHPDEIDVMHAAPDVARMYGVAPPAIPRVDHQLRDGQGLALAGLRWRVLHTPGHSPGSVSLVLPKAVFSGDVLFYGSVGRTDLPGGDYATLMTSIRELLWPLGDDTTVFCGHGRPTSIGHERQYNAFLV